MSIMSSTSCDNEFCPDCGSVLSLPSGNLYIICSSCGKNVSISQFNGITSTTRIYFNSKDELKQSYRNAKKNQKKGSKDGSSKSSGTTETPAGPVVEMECRKCGHNEMSYATLQTRSADEGQTIFYTCTKCGAQFNENS